ncbi:TlpA disulfide reductase family protein [Luteimonas sp. gir]|uniref:TlpA family protein disulfide reductase n=1 Tax=Luteimonas sp. gir TaxID=3127960 RepID=UPI003075C4E6
MTTRIIVGWLLACVLGTPLSASAGLPAIGQPPPDVIGLMPDGATYRISEQRGKVVVMAFWASWCGYCRKYTPVLEGLQRQVGKDQLDVVLVNFKEDARTYRTLRRQLKDLTVTWTHDHDGAISVAYGVSSVPYVFIIDRDGNTADIMRGYSEGSIPRLVNRLNGLLADHGPADAPHASAGDAETPSPAATAD